VPPAPPPGESRAILRNATVLTVPVVLYSPESAGMVMVACRVSFVRHAWPFFQDDPFL
jgi:hypothetical protein